MRNVREAPRWDYQIARPSSPDLDPNKISYEIRRWEDYYVMMDHLAEIVLASGVHYDGVITPLRGGIFPATVVASALNVPVYFTGAKLYKGIQGGSEALGNTFEVYQDFSTPPPKDAHHLIVDEVNHTSGTYIALLDRLKRKYGISNADYAVVDEKPSWRRKKAKFKVHETDSWIVYPGENSPVALELWDPNSYDGGKISDYGYKPWEFFAERLPQVMIRSGCLESWGEAMGRFRKIGFSPDELPDIKNPDFQRRLVEGLRMQYEQVFQNGSEHGHGISLELLADLLPGEEIQIV